MNLFRFEMRKLWQQKKLIWLFVIVFLCIGGILFQNFSQQSTKSERAIEKIKPMKEEGDNTYKNLKELQRGDFFDDPFPQQLEHINGIGLAFFKWTSAIYNEEWNQIPTIEKDFLISLEAYENVGGEFWPLQGIEKEKAIQKNNWLIEHNLSYEDEAISISPALILKEVSGFLLGFLGLFILLLFFGTTITVEMENRTWLTLKTQPISKWKLILGKYFSLLIVVLLYLAMVIGVGLFLPLILGGSTLNLQYPQILTSVDSVAIISTFNYLARSIVLFSCAIVFTFSLILLLGQWVKSSVSALMLTGLIVLLGFFATDMNAPLQFALNPFQYFRFSHLLAGIPHNMDWLYPLGAILWSCLLVITAIVLPEKETGLFNSSEDKNPFKHGKTKKHRNPIWNIWMFEWRKIRRNGLLKQLYIILALIVVFGYFIISQQAQKKEEVYLVTLQEKVQENENMITYALQNIDSYQNERENAEKISDEFYSKFYSDQVEVWERIESYYIETLDKNISALTGYEVENWFPFHDYQLHLNQLYYDSKEFDPNMRTIGEEPTISEFTVDASIEEKKWLLEHKVQPVFSGEFIPTIYSNWGNRDKEKKEWEEENRKIDNSGLFILFLYFDQYIYFIPLLLFLFLLGAGFSSEKGKRATLQFLKTQPISEKKVYLGKGIQATVTALFSSVGLFAFVILIATIFNRFGDWHYPILHYDSKALVDSESYVGIKSFGQKGFHFVSLGVHLLESIALFLCILLFIIGLSIFLSLFFKSQLAVFATTSLIVVSGYIGSSQLLTESAHLSPFTYLNIAKIMNGEVSTLLNNPSINFQTGSLVLLAGALFLYVIGYLLLSGKTESKAKSRVMGQ
ncbi:ABC transporter permease subunit [Sporosarcina sp. FA9]|uniref:ABC transporter permease subunit n=1 Tax=Sporosarcina sp. FA9 TaxID=3413030 RepID=UPI003F658F63